MPTSPHSASLLRVEFQPDGSACPPGDLLRIHVLFYPGQDELELRILAYVVSGHRNRTAMRVRSADGRYCDKEGNLLIVACLKRGEDTPIAEADVIVPYGAIDLPIGRHLLGYEIHGVVGNSIEFVTATRITGIRVSDERRGHIMLQKQRWVPDTTTEKQWAIVVEADTFHEAEFETTKDIRKPVFECTHVDVNIPGGYEREEHGGIVAPDDARPLDIYFTELEQRPWVPLAEKTVYFATNRNIRDIHGKSWRRFGNDVNEKNTFGWSSVTIPIEVHARGALELPRWWQKRNPERHFFVDAVEEMTERAFLAAVSGRQACKRDDILLFVHGFNNSFADATLRLAQLSHDIRFPGTPMVFSWPSEGRLGRRAYKRDEEKASQSIRHLAAALRALTLVHPRPSGSRSAHPRA